MGWLNIHGGKMTGLARQNTVRKQCELHSQANHIAVNYSSAFESGKFELTSTLVYVAWC
jgi:hypothetical protein